MAAMKEKKSCGQLMEDWKEFMWNPRTREFMGRTGTSWALIILFYIVFYGFLTALFTLTMWVMLQTIDDYKPTYQDRLATPGVMIRPKTDSLIISYNVSRTESWDIHVTALNNFLGAYNDSVQNITNIKCTPGDYFRQSDSGEVRNNPKRSCQFLRSSLGNCSGINDPNYGYGTGQPCVFIKMNRVIGMLPGGRGVAPFVNCTGKKDADSNNIYDVQYFPTNGTLDLMYFPYYGKEAQVNYSQPIVAVQFLNFTYNTAINVECKIVASNIATNDDKDKFAGRVSFTLHVNKN
ncbi:sodium/potassium-transporting ATPase subunit beta-2-like isoform X2 [Protopterus annectens]|uniref:sodium/potassium-transporting ATPase subunit beta-2-like isoform X2 n=1 Tax=Protopterus annectens TaxID=7888 RepID=UPI001CFB5A67|nr:sodium/potassium-transporting ATPase subunit beta-2-like isoform X2 [Protopterus annectens]